MLYMNLPNHKKHIILTGPVQSGKTSSLLHWAANMAGNEDCDNSSSNPMAVYGILTPVVPTTAGPKRVFMDIQTRVLFDMEAANPNDLPPNELLHVGRYVFLKSGFSQAEAILLAAMQQQTPGWLLIDEIGPLELGGQGLASAATLAGQYDAAHLLRVIWVVRNGLVEQVKNRFLADWLSNDEDSVAVVQKYTIHNL